MRLFSSALESVVEKSREHRQAGLLPPQALVLSCPIGSPCLAQNHRAVFPQPAAQLVENETNHTCKHDCQRNPTFRLGRPTLTAHIRIEIRSIAAADPSKFEPVGCKYSAGPAVVERARLIAR